MYQVIDDTIVESLGPAGAMKTFFTFSKYSPLAAEISRDGRVMAYNLPDSNMGQEALIAARLVITVFHLPLKASLDEFRIDDFVVSATINLKYVGR
jgi:hypothetical protein